MGSNELDRCLHNWIYIHRDTQSAKAVAEVENKLAVVVARSILEEEEEEEEEGVQQLEHTPVVLLTRQVLYSRLRDRSPCIQCCKPWDMQQVVLMLLGRSGVELELRRVVGVVGLEGKVLKCKLEEAVVVGEVGEEEGVGEGEEEGCE